MKLRTHIWKGGNRISTRQLYIDVINAKVKIDSKVQQTKISKKNTLEDFISDDIAKILDDLRKNDI